MNAKTRKKMRDRWPLSEATKALLLKELMEADTALVEAAHLVHEKEVLLKVATIRRDATAEAVRILQGNEAGA